METLSGKVAWNTGVQIGGKIVSTAFGVLITSLLARYLGPAGFGDYTFVLVFVLMFGAIADWGLSLIGVREASKYPENQGKIIGNVLVLRVALALIATVIANVVVWAFPAILPGSPNIEKLILIASPFILIFALKTSFQIVFNAKLKMQYFAISELAANAIGLILVLYLIQIKAGIAGFIWTISLGQFVSTLVALFFAIKFIKFDFRIQADLVRKIAKEAVPVGALLVLFTIYSRVDVVILGKIKGAEAVGYYGAAYRVYEVLVLGAAYFANSILPILSNLAHKDQAGFRRIYIKSFIILGVLGTFVSLVNFLLAPIAIFIIGGPEYSASILALQILSLAVFVSYFNHLNGYAIIALSKQWYSFATAIVAFGANLILNIVLIPKYSFYGAAFNTFITESIIVVLSLIILRQGGDVKFGFNDLKIATRELFGEKDKMVKKIGNLWKF